MWRKTAMPDVEKLLMVCVYCDAAQGEMAPQRFFIGTRKIEVIDVIDRWLACDYGYFKVFADDGGTYILKNDVLAGDWELTLYDSGHNPIYQQLPPAAKATI